MHNEKKNKLQKLLALAGMGSRRQIEQQIIAGSVIVNGKVASIGERASFNDKIIIQGKPLKNQVILSRPRVIIYNKPDGEICTKRDPKRRKTVFDSLPKLQIGRWIIVGRLDINTIGLLLFTTDGELANRLMHPSYQIERKYAVRIFGNLDETIIQKTKEGVMLKYGKSGFDSINFIGGEGINKWYQVTLSEGKNREVRRIFEAFNLQVSRLIRIGYGDITLPKYLRSGKFQELSPKDVNTLRQNVGMTKFCFPKNLLQKLNRKHKR